MFMWVEKGMDMEMYTEIMDLEIEITRETILDFVITYEVIIAKAKFKKWNNFSYIKMAYQLLKQITFL